MALALVALAANLVILLSDRAPGLFRRLSGKIDAGVTRAAGVAGTPSDIRVPQSDFDLHVALWGIAALLVGLAMWSWLSLLLGGATLFAVSVVVEGSQAVLTTTRTVQGADVAPNLLGVALGTVAVVVLAVLWRPVQAAPGPLRRLKERPTAPPPPRLGGAESE